MVERAKCIVNECLSAYYKKAVQADFSHLDRVHLCGESFEYDKKTYQVDLYANLQEFTLVATVDGWTICTFGASCDPESESRDRPEDFLLLLPRLDLHGILQDCVKISKGNITDDLLEDDRRVEAVCLAWMVVNEYTISDLIEALERHRLISSKTDIPSLFEEWEAAGGFDGDIWPLPPKPADCESDVETFYEDFRSRSTSHHRAGITSMQYHDDRIYGEDLEEDEDNKDEGDYSDRIIDSSEEGLSSRLKAILPYVEKANALCGFHQDLENLNPRRVILLDGTFADGLRYTVFVNLSDCSIISELPEWGGCIWMTFGVCNFDKMQAQLAQITPEWAEKNEDNWKSDIQFDIDEDRKQQDANVYAYENDPEYRSAADAIEARLNNIAASNLRQNPNGDTVTDEVGSSYGEIIMSPRPGRTYIEMTPDDLIAIGTEMKRASKRGYVEICVVDAEGDDGERGDVPGIFIHIPAEIKEDAPAETAPESAEPTET